MTIQEALEKLNKEKEYTLPARFHCRAIMVRTIAQYQVLLEELKKIAEPFPIDELFSGNDLMPNYAKLTEKEYQDKWFVLPGVSEYLRLFHASEERAQRFGSLWHNNWDASTTGRILIPLWGCDALWYDSALGLCSDLRKKEDLFDCTDDGAPQQMSIQVLSNEFEQYVRDLKGTNGLVFSGVKEWYEAWYEPNPENSTFLLLTGRYRSVQPTDGAIRIHVISDTLSFLREHLEGGKALTSENCPKEAQEALFRYALQGATLDDAILAVLNTQVFVPQNAIANWAHKPKGEKQLVFLWAQLHPDDSYLCHCIGMAKDIEELPKCILRAIFPARASHPNWVADSQEYIDVLPVERDDEYFERLDEMPSLEERLEYLSAESVRERIYILHLVGLWLRDDEQAVLQSERLKKIYPALLAYLSDGAYPDEELKSYFAKYKMYKLSNTLPQDEESYFGGLDTDRYDNRYAALSEEISDGDALVLWIDALGAEWLPLLAWSLERLKEGSVSSTKVVQALLPTETKFNELWKKMDVPWRKYDKLDKLAHKGVIDDKDYYACIEEQLHFVDDVVGTVDRLLKEHGRVLVVGDHGTSRLAARFFHKRDAMPLPARAESGSHGRFCTIQGNPLPMVNIQKAARDDEGKQYLVFANYDHYPKSGFGAGGDDDNAVFGEIHGGASPEEMLVPVIAVNRRSMPLTAQWRMKDNTVKVQRRSIVCPIRFSRPVSSVHAVIGEMKAECKASTALGTDWNITFGKLDIQKTVQFTVSLIADGMFIPMDPITVNPAIGGNDPF